MLQKWPTWSRQRFKAPFLLAGLALFGCLFETTPKATGFNRRLDYLVQVAPKGQSECRVEIRIKAWPAGEALILQAPIFYTDNPALPVKGFRASDLQVFNAQGKALSANDTLLPDISLDGNLIAIPKSAHVISYVVDLDSKDSLRFGIPIPGSHPGTDLIDGAYFFLLPLLGHDMASQWRTPVDIRLEFAPALGRTLVGTDAKVVFHSNYELMFVRAAYDPISITTQKIRNHEVIFYATGTNLIDIPTFMALFEKCIRIVEDSLLVIPSYKYFVGESPVFWGIEGSQGYWFKADAQSLPVVHVHELVHTFVGIYNGDYQDPWYKEGMTDYLGNLLALQAGLISDSVFRNTMLQARDTIPAVRNFALASKQVRNRLFTALDTAYQHQTDLEGFIQLVYGKGGQASMILDRYIYENSNRKYSVFNLVRDLNKNF